MRWYQQLQFIPDFLSEVSHWLTSSTTESFLSPRARQGPLKGSSRSSASSPTKIRTSQATQRSKVRLWHGIARHWKRAHSNRGPFIGIRFRTGSLVVNSNVG